MSFKHRNGCPSFKNRLIFVGLVICPSDFYGVYVLHIFIKVYVRFEIIIKRAQGTLATQHNWLVAVLSALIQPHSQFVLSWPQFQLRLKLQ